MYGNDFVEMYDNVIRMLGIEEPLSRLKTNADTNTVTFKCQASVVKLPLMRMREILESEDDLSQERGRVSY